MSELKRLRDEWHDAQGAQDLSLATDYIDELEKERKQFVERACAALHKAYHPGLPPKKTLQTLLDEFKC